VWGVGGWGCGAVLGMWTGGDAGRSWFVVVGMGIMVG
jgi:hypothetical protein